MKNGKKFDLSGAKELFFQESREMLDDMESFLLTLEKNFSDEETINSLFRAIHTIKGSSGMFALIEIEKFTHLVETLLDKARNFDVRINYE